MQFLNSHKKIILLGLIVGGLVIILILSRQKESQNTAVNEYYDTASGETVSDPPGKTPERYNSVDEPLYLGFSKLLDKGITKYQLGALKIAINQYSLARETRIDEASVVVATIKRNVIDADNSNILGSVSFDLLINRKDTYKATLQYSNVRSAELLLIQNEKEVYRSGTIDSIEDSNSPDYPEGDVYLEPQYR